MYMVGGGSGRVYGRKSKKNARRWMTPPKPKYEVNWQRVGEVFGAVIYFGVLIFALNVLALCFA